MPRPGGFFLYNPFLFPLIAVGSVAVVYGVLRGPLLQLLPRLQLLMSQCLSRCHGHLATGGGVSPKRRRWLLGLAVAVVVGFVFFEVYYQVHECKVSDRCVSALLWRAGTAASDEPSASCV
jgi:hypothetical protein